MINYDDKGCSHNRPKDTHCSFCEFEKRFNGDGYAPAKEYYKEDIEDHGAMYWYTQAGFWMDKFFETNKANEKLRAEVTTLRDLQ